MAQDKHTNKLLIIIAWIHELTSSFRLHAAIIFSFALVLNYLFLKSDIVYVACIIILLLIFLPSLKQPGKMKQVKSGNSLKMTSFNLQWNINSHDRSLQFIKNEEADIIVLQEVTSSSQKIIETFTEKFPYQYGEGHSHVMLLSKHKLNFVGYLPWPGKFQQRALHVTTTLNNQSVHIIALHMQVTRSWKELALRNNQIDCLTETLASISGPVIVIGDFNAGIGASSLNKIKTRSNLLGYGNFWHYHPTWPSSLGLLGIQLDHILTRGGFAVKSVRAGPKLESDHRPICAELIFVK